MWYLRDVAESYTFGHSFSKHYIIAYLRETASRAIHSDACSFFADVNQMLANVPFAIALRVAFREGPVWPAGLGTPLWSLQKQVREAIVATMAGVRTRDESSRGCVGVLMTKSPCFSLIENILLVISLI